MILYIITGVFIAFSSIFWFILGRYYKKHPLVHAKHVVENKMNPLAWFGLSMITTLILIWLSIIHYIVMSIFFR